MTRPDDAQRPPGAELIPPTLTQASLWLWIKELPTALIRQAIDDDVDLPQLIKAEYPAFLVTAFKEGAQEYAKEHGAELNVFLTDIRKSAEEFLKFMEDHGRPDMAAEIRSPGPMASDIFKTAKKVASPEVRKQLEERGINWLIRTMKGMYELAFGKAPATMEPVQQPEGAPASSSPSRETNKTSGLSFA